MTNSTESEVTSTEEEEEVEIEPDEELGNHSENQNTAQYQLQCWDLK